MYSAGEQTYEAEDGEVAEIAKPLADQNTADVSLTKHKRERELVMESLAQSQERLSRLSSDTMDENRTSKIPKLSSPRDSETKTLELVEQLKKRVSDSEDIIFNLRKCLNDNDRAIDHIKNILFLTVRDMEYAHYDMGEIANRGRKIFYDTFTAMTARSSKMWNTLLINGYANHLCIKKNVHAFSYGLTDISWVRYPMVLSRIAILLEYLDPEQFARNYDDNIIRRIDDSIACNKYKLLYNDFETLQKLRTRAIERGFR